MGHNYHVIIVEGLIGAGKSHLTSELGKALGENTLILLEPDEKDDANPYLAQFYENSSRWAFTMQIHLLSERFSMHKLAMEHVLSGRGSAVLDRSYFGDTAFAKLQLENKSMDEQEFSTYASIYKKMTAHVLLPSICIRILINPETALTRIKQRFQEREGRECENVIDISYLESLDRAIDNMVGTLQQQGTIILNVPWDVERKDEKARETAINSLATRIKQFKPHDLFIQSYKRIL